MRYLNIFLLIFFLGSNVDLTFGQGNCLVLIPAIADTYVGKCKKGLAHGKGKAIGIDQYEGMFRKGLPNGKGTYTWSTGEIYDGNWLAGSQDGVGVYVLKIDGNDSITSGVWKAGNYVGPVPERPQVLGSVSVEKFRFSRRGDGHKVLIDIYLNGNPNTELEDFSIIGSSGGDVRMGSSIGYDNVTFPFLCKVAYMTWNKFHTSMHYAKFEFEISEPGEWRVVIHNH